MGGKIMATYVQRIQAIGDALINGSATPTQLQRIGEALAMHGSAHAEYLAATNAGKAEIAVRELRKTLLAIIKNAESAEAVRSAMLGSSSAVDTDFTESP